MGQLDGGWSLLRDSMRRSWTWATDQPWRQPQLCIDLKVNREGFPGEGWRLSSTEHWSYQWSASEINTALSVFALFASRPTCVAIVDTQNKKKKKGKITLQKDSCSEPLIPLVELTAEGIKKVSQANSSCYLHCHLSQWQNCLHFKNCSFEDCVSSPAHGFLEK